jgi:membrane protease subunit HflK
LAVVALAAAYALSGVRVIGPAERGLVQRFGRVLAVEAGPGVHVGFPLGIERLTRVKAQRTLRVSIGVTAPDRVLGGLPLAEESQFITGDRNLVEVQMSVQYVIRDPARYLFVAASPELAVRHACEAASSEVLCGLPVDGVLTLQRAEIQRQVQALAQEQLDRLDVGAQLLAVTQERAAPPEAVADAFRAVTDAKADRERLLAEAEGYREDVLPRARGEAAATLAQAQADAFATVAWAQAEANRFEMLRAQVNTEPDVARRRLHAEAVEEALRRSRTVVVDPDRIGPLRLVEEGP